MFRLKAVTAIYFFMLASPLENWANQPWTTNAEAKRFSRESSNEDSVLFTKSKKFERNTVIQIARELSRKPFVPPEASLPAQISDLNYDEYRNIRYKPESAIWKNEDLPFQLQLLHRGSYFKNKVELAIVEDNKATHIPYNRNLFSTEEQLKDHLPPNDIGYSGFRIHFPLNTSDYLDELIVFQGATYFRALGKESIYGISARGFALGTAESGKEEFPLFKAFWIEKPVKKSNGIVVHALMDSVNATGAFRFTIRPGNQTITDVEVVLFPRADLHKAELAPLTSMYMFSMNGRDEIDDYRPQVHDSDGLLIFNGRNEHLWRPLNNPKNLQISTFIDHAPQGFGLMQRERNFASYEDFETHYEKRPSLWVELLGNWGAGSVQLIEIPTLSEIHDNIVAFWSPSEPLKADNEYSYSYRLIWGNQPEPRGQTVFVSRTASGRADILGPTKRRLYVIDYEVSGNKPSAMPKPVVTASVGEVSNIVLRDNLLSQGYRLSFEFDPKDNTTAELRAELQTNEKISTETWLYRYEE